MKRIWAWLCWKRFRIRTDIHEVHFRVEFRFRWWPLWFEEDRYSTFEGAKGAVDRMKRFHNRDRTLRIVYSDDPLVDAVAQARKETDQ